MVKHDIQNHFDSIIMKSLDQIFEFISFLVIFLKRIIAGIRIKEADCIIAPVLDQAFSVYIAGVNGFIELENRHQLNCIDAKLF